MAFYHNLDDHHFGNNERKDESLTKLKKNKSDSNYLYKDMRKRREPKKKLYELVKRLCQRLNKFLQKAIIFK